MFNLKLGKELEKYWMDIYRFCYYKVQNKEEAEEITQETMGKVYQRIQVTQVDQEKLKSYCFSTANNMIIDMWRKKSRRPMESHLEGLQENIIGIPDKQKEIEDKIMVREAMEQLPEQSRQILIWRIVEGYSIQEVAERLGKSPGAIKSMQFRGLQNLKDILEKGGYIYE